MSEDEKKDVQDETAEQDRAQDEGSLPAGPVAGEGTPSSQAAEGEPTPTPPAEEASGAEEAPAVEAEAPTDDAAAAEEKAEEAPAAEAESPAEEPAGAAEKPAAEAEPNPEDELPWKERRRLERSRRPHEAKPQLSPEERVAARAEERKRRGAERRKERAATKAKKTPGTGTPAAEKTAVAAKVRQGIVVSDRGQKSITVRVDIVRRHPTYEKVIRRSRTLHAHDERNEAGEGDVVRVVETRPLSKTKRWRLIEVLEKAK
jgi:small subunit ribosomal protein S17